MLHYSFYSEIVPDESLVSGVIVVPFFEFKCILVDVKTRSPRRYEFVAGRSEPCETAEETARREVTEEAGARVGSLKRIGYLLVHNDDKPIHPFPFPDSYLVVFAAQCKKIDDSLRHKHESAGIILCSLEDTLKHLERQPDWNIAIFNLAKQSLGFYKDDMRMKIRPMAVDDVPVVTKLVAECHKFLAEQQKFSSLQLECLLKERCSEKYIKKLYKEFPHYIAETEDSIAGVIEIEGNDIGGLWVLPKYHRQGVGKKLFLKAEELVVENGYNILTVHTTGYAIPFYEAMGMHIVKREQCNNGPLKGLALTFLEKPLKRK